MRRASLRALTCLTAVMFALACTAGPTPPVGTPATGTRGLGPSPWLSPSGSLSSDGLAALALLDDAAADGLDPDDYDAAGLRARIGQTTFDTELTTALLRFLHDLHEGRVDPRTLGFRIQPRPDTVDYAAVLREAVRAHRLQALPAALAPPFHLYGDLRRALAVYRDLAARHSVTPLQPPASPIASGAPYPDVRPLYQRLLIEGDAAADEPPPAEGRYDERLAAAVTRFQARHGLPPDGTLGAATVTALSTPLEERVRQIGLALERVRWLPPLSDAPLLGVNIPMFRLWAWDSVARSPEPSFDMGIIVGRALRTETPVFIERMDAVVFRPSWNVPASIVRDEILPAVARDPTYLDRQRLDIVVGTGDDATPVTANAGSLARLARGELRLRQRPGPSNALGLIKFVFPNDLDVYMHDTPQPELFSRSRRDFSHGCIRLESPADLAAWLLAGQGWSRPAVLSAMQGDVTRTVTLDRPVQVVLFYLTAAVMPSGEVHFAEDIYQWDRTLERALRARPRPMTTASGLDFFTPSG